MTTWLLGLLLCLLNCLLSSTGFILQRKAHLLSEQCAKTDAEPRWLHSIMWLVGVVLYLLAAVPDVLAYTMVPQVVCTTVACFRLVVVTVFAHFCLGEKVERREVLGMLACSLGTFLVLCFGPAKEGQVAERDFYHPEVVSYTAAGLGILILLLLVEHADLCGIDISLRIRVIILPFATGLAFALEKVFNTEIGSLRGPTSLKAVFSPNVWTFTCVFIALLGLTDFYLNLRAVRELPLQVFVPAAFAWATTLQFFQSVTIFREFSQLDWIEASLSISGAVVSLVGALFIQPHAQEASNWEPLPLTEEDPESETVANEEASSSFNVLVVPASQDEVEAVKVKLSILSLPQKAAPPNELVGFPPAAGLPLYTTVDSVALQQASRPPSSSMRVALAPALLPVPLQRQDRPPGSNLNPFPFVSGGT